MVYYRQNTGKGGGIVHNETPRFSLNPIDKNCNSEMELEIEKFYDQREYTYKYPEKESEFIKGLHEGYKLALHAVQLAKQPESNIHVIVNTSTNVALSADINIAYQALDNIQDYHTSAEMEAYRTQLDELKKIIESSETKTKKWEKAGAIIKWLAEQTVDVAKVFGPLILKGVLGIGE